MIFLLLLLLPSQLGVHFWPNWALVNGIRIDYLSPTLYLTDLIIFGLMIKNKTRIQVKLPIIILITLNIFFSLSPLTSIFKWLRILECYWLFRYLTKQTLISNFPARNAFSIADAGGQFPLSIAIVWTSILAWSQFIAQHSIGGLWYWLGERNFNIFTPNIAKVFFGELLLRPYATLAHPNVLGGWLVVVGITTGGWPMAIAFTTTLITFSRTAIFSVVVAILFLKRKWYLLPLLLIPFLIPGSPDSYSGRVNLIQTSLNIIRTNPLFGTGLGNFVRLTQAQGFQPVHNVFLLALSELGIPLFLVFCHLFIESLIHSLKIARLHSADAESICGQENWKLKIVIAVIVITAMSDHYWWTNPQMQLLFSLLAVFAVKYQYEQFADIYRRRSPGESRS